MLEALGILFLCFVVCFLLGSIPWGVIISRIFFKKDIRSEGSGNIGTTNAMRTLGKKGGAAVFLLDFGKGLLAGYIATLFAGWLVAFNPSTGMSIAAPLLLGIGYSPSASVFDAGFLSMQLSLAVGFLGCVSGHIYSPWLKFKGGKGIAVAVGALFFVFGVWGTLAEILIFAILVIATRYVSVGSLAAAVLCPCIALLLYWGNWLAFACIALAAILVIIAHRANINRLYHHCENAIGSKKEAQEN